MKRILTLVLCFVLFHSILSTDALALAPAPQPSRQTIKVATAVARLGVSNDSLIALRLQDRTVLKGHLSSVDRDSFVLTDADSGLDQRVYYSAVARLAGMNLANGTQVKVGGGFKAKLARVATFVLPLHRIQKNRGRYTREL